MIQTHFSRVAPDWDLWRTLYQLSCNAPPLCQRVMIPDALGTQDRKYLFGGFEWSQIEPYALLSAGELHNSITAQSSLWSRLGCLPASLSDFKSLPILNTTLAVINIAKMGVDRNYFISRFEVLLMFGSPGRTLFISPFGSRFVWNTTSFLWKHAGTSAQIVRNKNLVLAKI